MKSDLIGVTYLLHFEQPIGHSRHYLGWTNNLGKRLSSHLDGKRERCVLTHEARLRGIGFQLARVWEDVTIEHEKRLKSWKNNPKLCPICQRERS